MDVKLTKAQMYIVFCLIDNYRDSHIFSSIVQRQEVVTLWHKFNKGDSTMMLDVMSLDTRKRLGLPVFEIKEGSYDE